MIGIAFISIRAAGYPRLSNLLDGIDFGKQGGLVPVVVQDASSGEVLMLGYADRRALELTMSTGFAHFYSRSRRRLWMKGETSGNVLRVLDVTADCDRDAVFYLAVPAGNTCHTGRWTCFHNAIWGSPLLDELWKLIVESFGAAGRGAISPSPVVDCRPPPDPLLLSLSALALLRGYDRRVADAAVVAGGCPAAGIVMAQRLGLRAHLAGEPPERRLVVLGGFYDAGVHDLLQDLDSAHDLRLAAFIAADAGAPGLGRVHRLVDVRADGDHVVLSDAVGGRSARV